MPADFLYWSHSQPRGVAVLTPVDAGRGVEYLRAESVPPTPIKFRREVGRRVTDLMNGSAVAYRLLSPRAVQVLGDAGLTGWKTYPVVIEPEGLHGATDGYVGLSVDGRCGPVRREMARTETRISPAGHPYMAAVGLFFDPSSWDGSDVFVPTNTGHLMVTRRFVTAVTRARLSNFAFEPASDYEWV